MTREESLVVSDALVELGQTHTIVVGVRDGRMLRENYTINVTPVLSFAPADITALQRLGDVLGYGICFIAGSFTFTKADSR